MTILLITPTPQLAAAHQTLLVAKMADDLVASGVDPREPELVADALMALEYAPTLIIAFATAAAARTQVPRDLGGFQMLPR